MEYLIGHPFPKNNLTKNDQYRLQRVVADFRKHQKESCMGEIYGMGGKRMNIEAEEEAKHSGSMKCSYPLCL